MEKVKLEVLCVALFFFNGCYWGFYEGREDGEVEDLQDVIDGDFVSETDIDADIIGDQDIGDVDAIETDVDLPDGQDPDRVEQEIPPECGDGNVDPGEECDDGPDNSDTAPDACRTDCTNPGCGDSVTDSGEECDNGPDNSDTTPDACRTDCTNPACGDTVKDSGEECDDSSGFCAACVLSPPTDWVECADSSGNKAFLYIEDWADNHTWEEFRDHCLTLVEAFSPVGYQYYGLAVFSDQAIWDCILPYFGAGPYYIGLKQDPAAADYSEPSGGWYWIGYDGTGWINLSAFDPANGFITGTFDNAGDGVSDCGRLFTAGQFSDYSCVSLQAWDGICMIQF